MQELPQPVMSIQDIHGFLDDEFPEVHVDGRIFSVREIQHGHLTLRIEPLDRHLRPGGTVSGPTQFALADVAAYLCILAHIGPRTHTVTTNLNINFMHMPHPGPLDCMCTLLKLGKRLAVVECIIADMDGRTVSQATATYSIPAQ